METSAKCAAFRGAGRASRSVWLLAVLGVSACNLGDDGDQGRKRSELDAGEVDGTEAAPDCGLPIVAFTADVAAAYPGAALTDFALGSSSQELFDVIEALDSSGAQSKFPSVSALGPAEQRMTAAGLAIQLDGRLALNCQELRRLAYGGPKTVLDVAQAVNVAAGEPLGAADVVALPFERQYLVWEAARAVDLGEGLNAQAHQKSGGPATRAETLRATTAS